MIQYLFLLSCRSSSEKTGKTGSSVEPNVSATSIPTASYAGGLQRPKTDFFRMVESEKKRGCFKMKRPEKSKSSSHLLPSTITAPVVGEPSINITQTNATLVGSTPLAVNPAASVPPLPAPGSLGAFPDQGISPATSNAPTFQDGALRSDRSPSVPAGIAACSPGNNNYQFDKHKLQ